jgi:glycerophosphoryl diester phosphodiesterase
MASLDWLIARPVAHRGLHDSTGWRDRECAVSLCAVLLPATTRSSATLQLSADGEAMVFHDDTLERLTGRQRPVSTPCQRRRSSASRFAPRLIT